MNRRALIGMCATALLAATVTAQQPQAPSGGQQRSQPAVPLAGAGEQPDRTPPDQVTNASQITLIGCVQRESDYRQGIDSPVGTSGTAASGSNQFVLSNASLSLLAAAEASGRAVGTSGVTSGIAGMTSAYMLGGTRTVDLARHVGKRVEVKGAIAVTDPRSGNPSVSPTRPVLQTVTVSSIREIAGACKM